MGDGMENPRDYDPDFRGPVKSRSCTDILCLLLFIAFLAGWGIVGFFAFSLGNPEQLVHPTDSEGRICGRDVAVKDKPYLFFFDLTRCASPSVLIKGCPTPQVCVSNCPNETFVAVPGGDEAAMKSKMICKPETPLSSLSVRELIMQGYCAPWYIKSVPFSGRCVPKVPTNDLNATVISGSNLVIPGQNVTVGDLVKGSKFLAKLTSATQVVERVFQDFNTSWWVILIGLAVAALVSLIWILLMRLIAGVMVWTSIVAVVGLLSFGCYYCYARYAELKELPKTNMTITELEFTTNMSDYLAMKDTWLVFLIIIAVVLAIILLTLIFLRNRITLAIALIEQGSKAVGNIMSSLFFPLIPWILQFAVVGYFIAVAVYLASTGKATYKVTGLNDTDCTCTAFQDGDLCLPAIFNATCKCPGTQCQFFEYGGNPHLHRLQIYNLFGLFWGLFFVSALGEMVLAGAFASWYWAFHKPRDVPTYAVTESFYRTIRYHTGTLAFGSLTISVLRFIRVMLEYIDRKVKQHADNVVSKAIMCCCKCCFWCLERFMRFLNRNAYVMTAIYGSNFCVSAKDAFFLLLRNAARVVILDKVTDFLLFVGRLVVVGSIGLASFYVFSGKVEYLNGKLPELNYNLVPVITVTLGAYFIAGVFFNVYSMAVDTIFLCFLEDCERNDGTPEKPYFMSKDLMKLLGKKNKFTE